MSLPNPNKVVTEERLNEYHNTILPYLGGMPDILANKFSRADLYSTDEKMIGRWIDGKPLYQKTIDKLTCPNSTASKNYSHNIENVDFIKVKEAYLDWGASYGYSPIPVGVNNNVNSFVLNISSVTQTDIIATANKDRSAFTFSVTLQYTKTTDSPVEIGLDTDYSTTEKIVGTWIDGKPIWQCTCTPVDIANSTKQKIFDTTGFNIDTMVKVEGRSIGSSAFSRELDSVFSDTSYYASTDYVKNDNAVYVLKQPAGAWYDAGAKWVVTIKYTKTTD